MLLENGVLGYLMPLLLAYDTTYDSKEEKDQPRFDTASDRQEKGPAFLGLGFERSNMQVTSVVFPFGPLLSSLFENPR